jgi:hypothetical protein
MYKHDDTRRAAQPALASRLGTAAVWLALLTPFAAAAGLSTLPASRETAASEEGKPAAGTYHIRCWQYGKLLFEENRISLPASNSQYGVRIGGTDRNNRPIYVAETKNATCLIRSAVEERLFQR